MGKIIVFAFLFVLPWGVRAETPTESCNRAYQDQMNANSAAGFDGAVDMRFLNESRESCLKSAREQEKIDAQNKAIDDCVNETKAKAQSCDTNFKSALTTCDSNKLKSKTKASEVTEAEGLSGASEVGAKVSGSAKEAYTKFATDCEPVQKKCSTDCSAAKELVKKCLNLEHNDTSVLETLGNVYNNLTERVDSCNAMAGKVDEAKKGAKKAEDEEREATKVGESTGGGEGKATAVADGEKKKDGKGSGFNMPDLSGLMGQQQAQATPTPVTATASQGCDNPANNERVCQCLRNPMMCQATASSAPEGLGGTADFNSTGSGTPSGFDPNASANPFAGAGNMQRSGPSAEVGGKQGNGAGIGGGEAFSGAGGGGGRGGGAPPNDFSAKVNNGFYGGSSSGGGGRYGGGGATANSAATSAALAAQKPDLSKFLPGQKLDPNRGPASLVGKDGVTGPYDFNWDKMHRQFQRLQREGDNFLPY